jgi:hypothetical protein
MIRYRTHLHQCSAVGARVVGTTPKRAHDRLHEYASIAWIHKRRRSAVEHKSHNITKTGSHSKASRQVSLPKLGEAMERFTQTRKPRTAASINLANVER